MKAPYEFTGDYADCFSVPHMAMDPRHVFIVHEILKSWPFEHALELGSYHGASSTAFIEAINAGSGMRATFADISVTQSLVSVVKSCRDPTYDRCTITCMPSWGVLASDQPFDFILVDANHDLQSVTRELEHLIPRHPLCVMAHDTNATAAGYGRAEGAALLADTFRTMPGYLCIEECRRREGERTERGLFLATREPELFGIAADRFKFWSEQP